MGGVYMNKFILVLVVMLALVLVVMPASAQTLPGQATTQDLICENSDVVLIIDRSSSMSGSRLSAA